VAGEEFLGVCLRSFKLRSGCGGSETLKAGSLETVGDAGYEWLLRAYDCQIDALALRKKEECRQVIGPDSDVAYLGFAMRARIAGRDQDFVHALRLGDFPCQRMLATAAAHDQNLHWV
jgi:hypothetical protein